MRLPRAAGGSIVAGTAVKLLAFVVPAAVMLAACVLDLGDLTGGSRDGGATGGASASASAASTGTGGAGNAGSSASTGGGGVPNGVLDCGPCPGSGCAATTLASGADADGPAGIAVTSDGLYWANRSGGTVMRLAVGGGAPALVAMANGPVAVAVSGSAVAWAAQDGVYGCKVATCATTPLLVEAASVPGAIGGVAFDGLNVFYTDKGSGSTGGTVVACPAESGCPGLVTLGSGYNVPLGIALLDDQVFWTEEGDNNANGAVFQSPKGASGPKQIIASINLPAGVTADGANVYWTEATTTDGKVRRCPSGVGYCDTVDDLATGLAAPRDIALGGGRVYWSNTGDGRVLSCPVTGCGTGAPKVHASGRQGLRNIAVGDTCVFWTDDQNGGSVSKAAR
jgi:hypothetical protein